MRVYTLTNTSLGQIIIMPPPAVIVVAAAVMVVVIRVVSFFRSDPDTWVRAADWNQLWHTSGTRPLTFEGQDLRTALPAAGDAVTIPYGRQHCSLACCLLEVFAM